MDRVTAHNTNVRGNLTGGATIVFGHGLGGGQHQWGPIADHYAADYRVVTFDLAGSGNADPDLWSAERHDTIMGYADDLAALCGELGVRGATYVGHSMSGMAGALASAADPGLFSRLVLVCASARYIDDAAAGYTGGFSDDEVTGLLDAMEGDFALWAAGFAPLAMGNADRPEFASQFASTLAAYRTDIGLAGFRAAFTSDYRAVMPRVMVPTLVLQTPDDPAVPVSAAEFLADALPEATLELIDAQGHFPHVVAPGEVITAIDRFFVTHPC